MKREISRSISSLKTLETALKDPIHAAGEIFGVFFIDGLYSPKDAPYSARHRQAKASRYCPDGEIG
ncbi:hypothetical protein, partial [Pseudomonas viridiflava]|uniref:hypothetical protein n=1 Tax=Pseudomonas viridiflava TaxID=33069 RepID=UPI001F420432